MSVLLLLLLTYMISLRDKQACVTKIPQPISSLFDQLILNHEICQTLILRVESFLPFRSFKMTQN
jgi:hypothetical protein